MATIRQRGDSYQIRVSCGYDTNGKQVIRTKSWKPNANMTAKQIEKELNRQVVMFEDACMNGYMASTVKFAEFMERWKKEYAEKNMKLTTIDTMYRKLDRLNEEIGHMRIDKINRRTIQGLIQSLLDGNKNHKPLCAKSVKDYVSFVSSILNYAIKLDMLSNNPCRNANIPKITKKQREIYTLEEAQTFINKLIEKAPILYQCYFILAIYSGFRRGEMCGLTWSDIDFENHIITVNKALYHITHKGAVVDTPKSATSNRSLKLAEEVFVYLQKLKDFYEAEKIRLGTKWNENDFVFKREDGSVISPLAPNEWLHKFCERENLKYVVPHSFRHLNASLLIESGASVKTVQACLGHSDATTTLNIYAHSFAKAQAKASEAVASNFKLA